MRDGAAWKMSTLSIERKIMERSTETQWEDKANTSGHVRQVHWTPIYGNTGWIARYL
jgi:hypothetical protein